MFARLRHASLVLAALALVAPAAHAAWPHDPYNGNVPVCTQADPQTTPITCTDGAGGAIIVWQDYRGGGTNHLYAQRLDASGAPMWPANGVLLNNSSGNQTLSGIVPDGSGGAIVVYLDAVTGTDAVWAQHVSNSGTLPWGAAGLQICSPTTFPGYPVVASDGSGGAVVVWRDSRLTPNVRLFAQRVSVGGVLKWTVNGIAVTSTGVSLVGYSVAPDGSGGVFVAWSDIGVANSDIYAQRISTTGTPLWPAAGVTVCAAPLSQGGALLVADDTGGAIVAWSDNRGGNYDVYAQRLAATGVALWAVNGVPVLSAAADQYAYVLVRDGAGGAIVVDSDNRAGNNDVYAQRVNGAGLDMWTATGIALCAATTNQYYITAISDGSGGAIACWTNEFGVAGDVYAQRISGAGVTQWATNGAAISAAANDQEAATLTTDGAGGAILSWYDWRNGGYDIYAQRIERNGQLGNPEPSITRVSDVRNDQGGFAKVAWNASYLDVDPVDGIFEYRIWRSAPAASPGASARRAITSDPDEAVRTGALLAGPANALGTSWQYVATQPAALLPSYEWIATTTGDSIGGSNPMTSFMIEARVGTAVSSDHWYSAPDSGYSVDNLPPVAPAPFTGQYAAGTAHLQWNPNAEGDLAGYRLYRGGSSAFVPGPGNLVAQMSGTSFTDAPGAPVVYKLTAVDIHGNESLPTTLLPTGVLAVDGSAPAALAFAAPQPNPAATAASFAFALPGAANVRLALYDAAGREVRVLVAGAQDAGRHIAAWDLRDATGGRVAAGLYFARFEAAGRRFVQRVAVTR